MAVIHSEQEAGPWVDGGLEGKRCALCGAGTYVTKFPTIIYRGDNGALILCHSCCRALVPGLIADLIQVEAILKIRDLGYSDATLTRRFVYHRLRPLRSDEIDEDGRPLFAGDEMSDGES